MLHSPQYLHYFKEFFVVIKVTIAGRWILLFRYV